MTSAPGSLGDPILISDSPPHVSHNERDHPRQGFASHHHAPPSVRPQEVPGRGRWVDGETPYGPADGLLASRNPSSKNTHPQFAPSPASKSRTAHEDSMVDEYGRTVPRPRTRPIIPPIPRPAPLKLTEQHRVSRASNPYLKERAADQRLPIPTLPYNVKYSLLQSMQRIMEEALFDWAKEWAPAMLKMAGWETAEAGELNWWSRTIDSYSRRVNSIEGAEYNARPIPADAFSQSAGMNMQKLNNLLGRRLAHIRHAAVHRDPSITVSALKEMLADCHYLTEGLRDRARSKKLHAMQLALEANDIKWMDAMMATPVLEFNDDFDPKKFRSQPSPMEQENIRPGALKPKERFGSNELRTQPFPMEQENTRPGASKRKRSETPLGKISEHRLKMIKHSGELLDLTMDLDDGDMPPPNPDKTEPARVIDLTGDEVVVLFRSTRGPKALT